MHNYYTNTQLHKVHISKWGEKEYVSPFHYIYMSRPLTHFTMQGVNKPPTQIQYIAYTVPVL